ncbi:substrate-binding domain-containing protein [Agrobacterium sp. MCAB5]|uniref:substrate-binding domain-containing protein n=1 Tax=Agrobacterium sp. MCAB5 TaxID=3233042 RepID=UPI003F916CE2
MLELPSTGPGGGGAALAKLLDARPNTQAVFFASGALASDALTECNARGWKVPQRLTIAGFDDYESVISSMASIPAVRVPRYEIGCRATEVVLASVGGGDKSVPKRTELPLRSFCGKAQDPGRGRSAVRCTRPRPLMYRPAERP